MSEYIREILYAIYAFFGVIGILLAIVTFRIKIVLDYNKWLDRKDKRNRIRLQAACPHQKVMIDGDNMVVVPFTSTFLGQHHYTCTVCGLDILNDNLIPIPPKNWDEAIAINYQLGRYNKLAKKLMF